MMRVAAILIIFFFSCGHKCNCDKRHRTTHEMRDGNGIDSNEFCKVQQMANILANFNLIKENFELFLTLESHSFTLSFKNKVESNSN